MNMKRIVFKIANHFALALLHCCSLVVVIPNLWWKRKEKYCDYWYQTNGLGYELKSKEVPYITRASGRNIEQFYLSVYREDNRDIKLDAILVKENIDENNYILYHYTTDEVLFATLYISDNTLKDIKLEFDDENLVKTRSLASWYQCANDEYQNYKDFMRITTL